MPPLDALRQTPVTALVHCDGRLIVMLDFEMIIDQVTRQAYRVGAIENSHNLPREALRIIMCDDSPTIRQAVSNTLRESGYTQLEIFENGAQAWRWIEERLAETGVADGVADLVISDIEMPQVDGLHLTKRIKEHPQLRELPVLLYSSIITPDNMKKGKAVGANIQISKPELNKIVEVADGLIAEARGAAGDATANRAESLSAAEERSEACAPAATKTAASPAKVESVAAEVASAEPDARADARADVASPANSAKGAAAERKSSSRRKSPAKKSADESLPAGVPHGVSGQLWQTFLDELADHIAAVTRQIADAAGDSPGEEAQNIFRTLHTIKSASMVIPCAPITRATHAVEGLLTPLRRTPAEWPTAILASYVAWLETIANPMIDVNEALSLAPIAQLFAEPGQPAS
jgi:CheY-like chemotaxis protein